MIGEVDRGFIHMMERLVQERVGAPTNISDRLYSRQGIQVRAKAMSAARAAAQLVEAAQLVLGALLQRPQLRLLEPRLARRDPLQRPPQRELAADARDQALDLDEPGERGELQEMAVGLEPPGLLGGPAEPAWSGRSTSRRS